MKVEYDEKFSIEKHEASLLEQRLCSCQRNLEIAVSFKHLLSSLGNIHFLKELLNFISQDANLHETSAALTSMTLERDTLSSKIEALEEVNYPKPLPFIA